MKTWILLFIFVFVQLGHRRFSLAGVLYPGDNKSKSSEIEDLDSSEKESVERNDISEDVKGSKPVIKPETSYVSNLLCAYCYEILNEEARLQCIRTYCESGG